MGAPALHAQSSGVTISVRDRVTKEPVGWAYVMLGSSLNGMTDSLGICTFDHLGSGTYTLKISHLNYNELYRTILVGGPGAKFSCMLVPVENVLNDIYVIAKESKGMTSSSNIGRDAIERIQPSSFADLLELLPGGYATDPALATHKSIALREVGRPSYNYNTSSLGTAFILDGRRINTDANMQWMLGATNPGYTGYMDHFVNSGVDMRSISTDEIDSVVVVRGIPSVRYGELTSGLVQIERKKGRNILDARFKADRNSKLYYVGKGFGNAERRTTLNMGFDCLDYNPDPRTSIYGYKRYTGSIRGSKDFLRGDRSLLLNMALDFVGSLDTDRQDAEINDGHTNRSKSNYNSTSLSTKLGYRNKRPKAFFSNAEMIASVSYEHDVMERERYMYSGNFFLLQTNKTEGEFDAMILPHEYTGWQKVDGKPFYASAQTLATFLLPFRKTSSKVTAGGEWNMAKNYGKGQVFEEERPPMGYGNYRVRPYVDVPATHNIGLFVENQTTVPVGKHHLRFQAGARSVSLLSLDKRYAMRGRCRIDPRINLQWEFPKTEIFGKILKASITGGLGWQSKMPTLDQLYPEMNYDDITEFAMLSPKNLARVHYRTFITDPTNYALQPARNAKWEVRADVEYAGISATVTWYCEDMRSGFRKQSGYHIFDYVRYSLPKGMNWSGYSAPIPLSDLDAEASKIIRSYGFLTNGSRTFKKGLEYTLMTPRYKAIATRFVVSGAWTYTKYENSVPFYEMSSRSTGSGKLFQLIGNYLHDDSYLRWLSNTNFNADTYLPFIGLGFSLSFQCFWTQSEKRDPFSSTPVSFVGIDGIERPYTKEALQEIPELNLLTREMPSSWFERKSTPFSMNVNLKATKKLFKEKIGISIFVNKLFDWHPDYKINNFTIRRYVNAYFGMEMNIRL